MVISFELKILNFWTKSSSLLFLKTIPFLPFWIISIGPGQALEQRTGALQKPASIKTNPGSSHKELKTNPFEFLNIGYIFSICPKRIILSCKLFLLK